MSNATPQLASTFKRGVCRTLSRQQKSWGRIQADHVRRTGLGTDEISVSSLRHTIVLNLRGSSRDGQYYLDGRGVCFEPRRPGSVVFIPAGCTWSGWETGASTAAYLSISVAPGLVEELLLRNADRTELVFKPNLGCEDEVLTNAARGIGGEIHERSPFSTLLVESYVATMFAQLLRRQQNPIRTPSSGGLTPAVLRRIMTQIEEDLDDDLSLSKLAGLAGLSIPHFCRAFKESVGRPPHTFVIGRRLDRAKEHLRHSNMSITQIALACGFSNSSHFANTFRREVGTSPAAFRAG